MARSETPKCCASADGLCILSPQTRLIALGHQDAGREVVRRVLGFLLTGVDLCRVTGLMEGLISR